MSSKSFNRMSYIPKNNQYSGCFKIMDSKGTKPISCGDYLKLYYNFITNNPLKFSGDFIREVGNCGISDCDLPSDR